MYQFRFLSRALECDTAAEMFALIGDRPKLWQRSRWKYVGRTRMEAAGHNDCVSDAESLYFVLQMAGKRRALRSYIRGWKAGNQFRAQFNAPLRSF